MKMKLILLSLASCAVMAVGAIEIGKGAPDFQAKDINGKTHKLSDYKGKIVVLESINLDCPFSLNHYETGAMPELQTWAKEKGVVWLVVNSINPEHKSHRDAASAKKEWEKYKIKANAWIDDGDGKVGKAYGLRTTPHMVVIDKTSGVAYEGAIDDRAEAEGDPRTARNYVRDAVNSLLAGEKPKVTQTKPYGCGIKYKN